MRTVDNAEKPATSTKEAELLAWAELVAIGVVAKSQGRKGEVAVNPLTDFPERFIGLRRVLIEGAGGEPVRIDVEAARVHKGRPVVKFVGVSNISEAQALAGKEMLAKEYDCLRACVRSGSLCRLASGRLSSCIRTCTGGDRALGSSSPAASAAWRLLSGGRAHLA